MALPKSYLTSTKRLPDILEAIQTAQAPTTFSNRFLENLGFKSKGDRLMIGVLKSLDFLDESGKPKNRYYQFLDQSQSGRILADAIREAYSDLFALNVNAHQFNKQEFIGKVKTLSQGQLSDNVIDFMYLTFSSLVKNADFTSHTTKHTPAKGESSRVEDDSLKKEDKSSSEEPKGEMPQGLNFGGLVYNIQIVLPETRDAAVYDSLFRSLKEHLL